MDTLNRIPQLLSKALVLHQSGRLDDAADLYRAALASDPTNADALTLLGVVCLQRGNLNDGIRQLETSLTIRPHQPDALKNLGNALRELKRYDDAVVMLDKAIVLQSDDAEAYCMRGNALQALKRYDEALASFDKAICLQPGDVEAYFNRGNALQALKRYDDSLASYDKAIALMPSLFVAHNNRGVSLRYLKRYTEALASYDRAIAMQPEYATAYLNRGNVFQELRQYDDALWNYDKAIAIAPHSPDAHANLALTLQDMKHYDDALLHFEQAMILKAHTPYLSGSALHTKMQLCNWQGIDALLDILAKEMLAGGPASLPFAMLATPLSALQQKQCAETIVQDKYPPAVSPLWKGDRSAHDKIRIGYFSADFHNHATSYLMAKLFELHDRSRFEVTGFSFGPPSTDAMRNRLEKAFDRFLDVSAMADLEIATLARNLEIDIAIDLKGFTQDSRTGIFALRAAPIQVNYLGYPGTMGASYIDYLIADSVVIPEEHKPYYTEKLAYLPNSYQVNDSSRRIAEQHYTRQEMGLPENGVVLCCFNSNYKITPDIFDIWMRLLHKVPVSVLWLIEGNASCVKNLRAEARARGIAENRLVFTPRMSLDDHLARHRLADLFLDTFNCNAHTTASDALWAGVPVLTCLGKTFAGRVAASLLYAVDLPELVTRSHAEYELLALDLATSPGRLALIKAKLARNRATSPLFNTAIFTKHIEEAYARMQERSCAGLLPDDIYVRGRV